MFSLACENFILTHMRARLGEQNLEAYFWLLCTHLVLTRRKRLDPVALATRERKSFSACFFSIGTDSAIQPDFEAKGIDCSIYIIFVFF